MPMRGLLLAVVLAPVVIDERPMPVAPGRGSLRRFASELGAGYLPFFFFSSEPSGVLSVVS